MKKITIKTKVDSVSWGINKIKYLVGNNIEWKHEIMRVLIAHFSRIGLSEYDEQKFYNWKIHVNDVRHDSRKTYFIRLNQYYDYETHAKMTAQSILTMYVNELSKELPNSDEYVVYDNIYKSLIYEHAVNNLNISTDSVEMKFNSIPITPKIFQKFLKPHLEKEHLEANGFNLTLYESINLQCQVIKKLANVMKKEIMILYDGPINKKVKESIENVVLNSKNIMCIINVQGNHAIKKDEIGNYAIISDDFIDLASIYDIADKIEMDMPYAGDRESFKNDLELYTRGKVNDKNSYLSKFFGYL